MAICLLWVFEKSYCEDFSQNDSSRIINKKKVIRKVFDMFDNQQAGTEIINVFFDTVVFLPPAGNCSNNTRLYWVYYLSRQHTIYT